MTATDHRGMRLRSPASALLVVLGRRGVLATPPRDGAARATAADGAIAVTVTDTACEPDTSSTVPAGRHDLPIVNAVRPRRSSGRSSTA